MKKEYVSPKMVCETFAADEYVAACGDSGKVYLFECDAKAGLLYYYPDSDGNIDGTYQGKGNANFIWSYKPCGAKHEAESTSAFYDGFVDYNLNGKCDKDGSFPLYMDERVIVWRGPQGDNGHATKNLDINSWETAKS